MTASAAIAARIIRTDRALVAELRDAGAQTVSTAARIEASGLRARRVARLANAGVLRSAGDERYYLDEQAWTAFETSRRTRMFFVMGLVLTALVIGLLLKFVKF